MSVIISIASGKGGVGKTLITSTLAITLQRRGYSVLAVDADMGLRNLDLMFGVQDEVLYDAVDIVKQRCTPDEAVITICPGLDFLPASQKHTWEKVDAPSYQYVLEGIAEHYDYVILDCPPGRDQAYKKSVFIADRIFFVVAPTWTSMRDASRVMQFCDKHKKFNYAVLLNNFYRDSEDFISVRDMLGLLEPESLAGILPHSDSISAAAQHGMLMDVPDSEPFFTAMSYTVNYIENGSEPPISKLEGYLQMVPHIIVPSPASSDARKHVSDEQDEKTESTVISNVMKGPTGLSLRQRRSESAAWRRYRR